MRGTITVPIEYFVWASQSPHQERLIYYDEKGNQIEHTVKAGSIQAALAVFDGRLRSVRRSTGGLTPVEPYQLVLVTHEDNRLPSVRVRVRFIDVRFIQKENGSLEPETFQTTKIVAPEQLQSAFDYELVQNQRFVADFGQGIVPVQVIHLDRNESDQIMAFFVDPGEVNRVGRGRLGDRTWVQVYSIPREALRLAENTLTQNDWTLALGNYERIFKFGSEMIPDCQRSGYPIETIAGYHWEDLRDFLQLTLTQRKDEAQEGSIRPVFEPLTNDMEKEYMPVGLGTRSLRG